MLNAREDHLKQFHQLNLDEFYKQGLGWVVSSHELQYLRPANYNETVLIQSDLLEAGDTHLMVEVRMLDETRNTIKAVLWTKFTCVNIKTGRRENHSADFMNVLKDLLFVDVNIEAGLKERIEELARQRKAATI